jgi:hypothetical protein
MVDRSQAERERLSVNDVPIDDSIGPSSQGVIVATKASQNGVLAAASNSSSVSTAASSVPPTTVASLIQSAAKMSLLDAQPTQMRRSAQSPTKLFDDDEYDNMDETDSLRSLRKVTLPAMPDEQDRKRFVVRLLWRARNAQ